MKKAVVFIWIIFTATLIHAQNFQAGIRFGLNGSQVNGDRLSGFNKLGLTGGAYVKRKLSDLFTMQMEIVFIQKGSRKPTDINNSFYRMRVHYLEVPVLLRWTVSKKIDISAGPSFGSLIFSQEANELGVYFYTLPFRKFELSGNIGLIYKFDDMWSFDARYSESITTIRPYPGGYTTFFDRGQYNVLVEFSLLKDF